MTAQPAFDTLAFVKRLTGVGMDTRHAEALAEALSAHAFEDLATKRDIKELRAELKLDTRELELRLTQRMGALTAATIAILGTLIAVF